MPTLRVNVVLHDYHDRSILIRRLETYASRVEDFSITCTRDPIHENKTDCYIVSCDTARLLIHPPDRPRRWKPVIAFGPADMLREAYMDGCTDYLKDPWQPEELYLRSRNACHGNIYLFPWGSLAIEGLKVRAELRQQDADTDTDARSIDIRLNERQISLLEALLALRGTVVERDLLYFAMWERSGDGSRAVDMQIHGIRDAMESASPRLAGDGLIRGVYGVGYIID